MRLSKIFETLKIHEESHADNKAIEFRKYVGVFTYMSLMLCAHSLYCDMSQLIVLLAYGNVKGLKKLQKISVLLQFTAEFHAL